MYNKYQAEQVLLSDEVRKQREEEIMVAEGAVREMQKKRFGPEGDLFNKRQELVSPIQDKVYSAIEDFASDRGYDLIFDKGGATGLLFVTDEYDKTADVYGLEVLNENSGTEYLAYEQNSAENYCYDLYIYNDFSCCLCFMIAYNATFLLNALI